MVKLDFVIPRDYHIKEIVDNLRDSDREELLASGFIDIHEALIESVRLSKTCVVACLNHKPMVIYGMFTSEVLTGNGVIWMLGVKDSLNYPRELMVYTRRVLDEMFLEYSTLMNYVHFKNTVSIKWLKALGFTICEPQLMGREGEMFHKFYRRK